MNIKSMIDKAVSALAVIVLYTASTASTLANQNDEVILYLNDPLGSAVAAYDENGDVCWEEAHTPYGDKTVMEDSFNRQGCGVVAEERGFTGHSEDFETDLVYMQQRYYDPTVGRFLSTDPIGPITGDPGSTNRYSYGKNNPYRYTDPDGRFAEDLVIGVPSLIAGGYSLYSNIRDGKLGSAALDVAGIVADGAAIALPGVPGGAGLSIKAGRAADAAAAANKAPEGPEKLYHYTDNKGLDGILSSEKLNPSLKASNPNDARYGNGQYLSDIAPGTKTCAQLSRCFFNNPFQGKKVENYVEIDVRGLNAQKGRDGVYLIPGETPLDLTNRITGSGKN